MLLKGMIKFLRRAHPTRTKSSTQCVRIIHAGGRQELYQDEVPAFQVMKKYPGMIVARPQVFRLPQESILWPQETLEPGQKYYMIPMSTMKKLTWRHQLKGGKGGGGESFIEEKPEHEEKGVGLFRRRKVAVKKKLFVPPIHMERVSRSMGWEPSLTSVKELSP